MAIVIPSRYVSIVIHVLSIISYQHEKGCHPQRQSNSMD